MLALDSYVALGDSFTEGMDDPAPDGTYVGWADRLAAMISSRQRGFRYANLAIRGKLLQEIVDEQVPLAVALKPQLVTFCGGGNDLLVPGSDPDALAEVYEIAVAELRAAGCEVVIFTGFDTRNTPLLRSLRSRVAVYNSHLWSVAQRYHCRVVDLWSMQVLHDRRAWSEDRLHLSSEGHRRVALRVAEVLGLEVAEDWNAPWPPLAVEADWMTQRRHDLKWAREHVVPWIARQLRGESMGDGIAPKRPELLPVVGEG
ncbi:SGNH/GDSL hydrolase family protein [Saccharothrix coeruleofusca]|uniref:SGNH hydrolase n=1 Tax=Saccharothrix coeruleofusca TaxID=33919 RepID=A0A918ECD8_9PSEU|nr:SGNH/GDSL hydrolase family protein [Saccharothrix coeruleofusca]MBP2340434.1 lysophospholipase L1-like esterase [Saccharothrix coeruleofusca]GGP35361.1 SGNH hydrolase [Saccharothrix coeruleofusca]